MKKHKQRPDRYAIALAATNKKGGSLIVESRSFPDMRAAMVDAFAFWVSNYTDRVAEFGATGFAITVYRLRPDGNRVVVEQFDTDLGVREHGFPIVESKSEREARKQREVREANDRIRAQWRAEEASR